MFTFTRTGRPLAPPPLLVYTYPLRERRTTAPLQSPAALRLLQTGSRPNSPQRLLAMSSEGEGQLGREEVWVLAVRLREVIRTLSRGVEEEG